MCMEGKKWIARVVYSMKEYVQLVGCILFYFITMFGHSGFYQKIKCMNISDFN